MSCGIETIVPRTVRTFPCEAFCQNGGTFLVAKDSFKCLCADGFTGVNCETNVDDCEQVICLNNGTCQDGINSYTCNCPKPIIGIHCEIGIYYFSYL